MNQEKIGKFIQKLRKEKNLTQQELANLLGVTDRAISKWENGRGLPDYSLIKPLCDELGITINELLSGEKIQNNQLQNKFEENVLNTLDYSNKKIKHTKTIFKFILLFIILFLVTLITLFGIDINRMRNNEPVFFSTWGFKYAPPINLDTEYIEKTIKDYFIKEDEANKHYENEKSFVALRTYLITEMEDKYYVYTWILQEKYYLENGEIKKDSASSIPYKIEVTKENDKFIVTDYEIPRDGSYYAKDMKFLFPNGVLKDMDNIHNDGTIEKLQFAIKEQVNLYFHDILNNN